MPIYKDTNTGTWYVKTYYTDYTGTKKQKMKRGFKLQRKAKEWEHDFLLKQAAEPSMPFKTLCALYLRKSSMNANDQPPSPGYMQNLVTELSSVFNFAVRLYGLSVNPCRIAGNTVGKKQRSLNFWIKDEFDQFIATFDKSDPFYTAFLILYYTGPRIGKLEALMVGDNDLDRGQMTINKTYHC